MVRFKTDDTINWKGFSAAFVLASPDAQPITMEHTISPRRYDPDFIHKPKGKKYTGKEDPGSIPIDSMR